MKENDQPELPPNEWELEGGKNTSPLQVVPFSHVSDGNTIDPRIIESYIVGEIIVKLPDGSFARLRGQAPTLELVQGTPRHTLQYLVEWMQKIAEKGNYPEKEIAFYRKLVNDDRMKTLWQWLDANIVRLDRNVSSLSIAMKISRARNIPGKPGDMTPAVRKAYFDKVRRHAIALSELLSETIFDYEDCPLRELSDEKQRKSLGSVLRPWGDDEDEDGHVVAFLTTSGGQYELPYDFQNAYMTKYLRNVEHWTYWDDNWDGSIYGSSAPIVQSNSASTRVVYFTCTIFEDLLSDKIDLPFPILATIANVALDLPPDEQVDEDAVRRQVRRFQSRQEKYRAEHPYAFE